ncbi:MAG: FkbM family methyltransferase [bacterium]
MTQLNERIIAHHVGARGFGVALNCPPRFTRNVFHVTYEADEACARDMINSNKDSSLIVLPYCLGHQDQPCNLYIMNNQFMSSTFKPNQKYNNYYIINYTHGVEYGLKLNGECYDLHLVDDNHIAKIMNVNMRKLDSVIRDDKLIRDFPPDFLSLDTQGSEFNILLGAQQTFKNHVMALATEIEFHQLYEDQHLFSHIHDFAHSHGFHFAGFTNLQEIMPCRLPVGARQKGFTVCGDALFFRSIESVLEMGLPNDGLYLALLKLAFIAMNFGYLEYAMHVVDAADIHNSDQALREKLMSHDCYRVLYHLRCAIKQLPPDFLHTSSVAMTDELKRLSLESTKMNEQNVRIEDMRQQYYSEIQRLRIRHLILTDPLSALYKAARYSLYAILKLPYVDPNEAKIQAKLSSLTLFQLEIQGLSPEITKVEQILIEYGYTAWADEVRQRRSVAEHCIAGKMFTKPS